MVRRVASTSNAAESDPARLTKLRGGFYTPDAIARFLCEWAVSPGAAVLEPSCGDGRFLDFARRTTGAKGSVTAVEIDEAEAGKAATGRPKNVSVLTRDAFRWFEASPPLGKYDAVVGNPPFIRYQDFRESSREPAFELMRNTGLRPTRLTNAWVPFVVLATQALREGGRLAMVLPAELMQVTYAGELRGYLAREYSSLDLVTFRTLVFPEIQQEIVLLLGVRGHHEGQSGATIRVHAIDDLGQLPTIDTKSNHRPAAQLDHATEKWTQYYLTARELAMVREIHEAGTFSVLGDIADVDVGVVTGRNEFFVLSDPQVKELGLQKFVVPLVARSAQIAGASYSRAEWRGQVRDGQRNWLLQLGKTPREKLSAAALAYVEEGEERKFHTGYKCRIRQPTWWFVPSTAVPDGFMLRQIHEGPKIAANRARATCTDTIHRVRMSSGSIEELAACSVNSLTCLLAEIRGRSYGGGVLELEPTEAEELLVPNLERAPPLSEVDALIRKRGIAAAAEYVDEHALLDAGLGKADIRAMRAAWRRLRERRINRRQTRRSSE